MSTFPFFSKVQSRAQEICPAPLFLRSRGSPGPEQRAAPSTHLPRCCCGSGAHILQHCWWFPLWAEGLGSINPWGVWSATTLRAQVQHDQGHPGKPSSCLPPPEQATVSGCLWALSYLCYRASKLSNPVLTIPKVSLWEEHGLGRASFIVSVSNVFRTKTFLWGWKFFSEPANYFYNPQSALTFLIVTINPHSSPCPRCVQGNKAYYAEQHPASWLICQKDYCTLGAECEELAA